MADLNCDHVLSKKNISIRKNKNPISPPLAGICSHLLRSSIKKGFKILKILFLFSAVLFSSCAPPKGYYLRKTPGSCIDNFKIRVLLQKSDGNVLISSDARMRITDIKTGSVKYDGTGRDIKYNYDDVISPLLIESWDSPVNVDNVPYRGIIELHNVLGKIFVINVLSINEYLYGVVPSEIPASWNIEALKAQAVSARTYTYHHLKNGSNSIYNLDSTTKFQVYKGYSAETAETNKAVDETSGIVILYKNAPIVAFFHSACGGRTVDDKYVWNGDDKSYLKSINCPYCKNSPNYEWEERITLDQIKTALTSKYRRVGKITGVNLKRNDGRVNLIVISHRNGAVKMSGNDFRLLFPDKKIRSLYFSAAKVNDGLILRGHGWGHGVGMCQWGAKGMAEAGRDFKDILNFYYRDITISSAGINRHACR